MQLQYLRSHFGAVKGQFRGRFMQRGAGRPSNWKGFYPFQPPPDFWSQLVSKVPAGFFFPLLPHGGKLKNTNELARYEMLVFRAVPIQEQNAAAKV